MTKLDEKAITEIEARAEKAFKGPWIARTWEVECCAELCVPEDCEEGSHVMETVLAPEEYPRDPDHAQTVAQVSDAGKITTPGLEQFASANAAFIAAARTDVPLLCAALRQAWKERDEARLRAQCDISDLEQRLDSAEKERDELRDKLDGFSVGSVDMKIVKERDEARARVAALETALRAIADGFADETNRQHGLGWAMGIARAALGKTTEGSR